jgi:UDP-glucose 4-epimerase
MNILITGGSGFIGSHVADKLSEKGHKVTIYDSVKSLYLKKGQFFFKGNILNFKLMEKVVKKNDVVYHFAGLSDLNDAIKNPLMSVKLNILATVKLLDLCIKYKIKRFVHASSVYANSKNGGFYRSSKKAAEEYIEEYKNIHKLKFTVLRFGSLYGSRSKSNNGLNKILSKAYKKNQIVYSGTKNSVREYINVEDAAKACVKILSKKFVNKYVIITGSKKIRINQLLFYIKNIIKTKNPVRYLKANKHYQGHYTSNPYTYKSIMGQKLNIPKQRKFFNEIKKYFTNKGFI